jgi:Protein of unknown function (DUF559)
MGGRTGADAVIAALAEVQGGRVARKQLLREGVSARSIEHRLATGRLHRVHTGVYAVGHRLTTPDGRWWAALLAYDLRAFLGLQTAAEALELAASRGGPVELTSVRTGGRRPSGVRIHRTRRLPPNEVTEVRGMPVTTAARTVLDLAARLPERRLEQMLDRGEASRVLDLDALRQVLDTHPARAGTPRLRRVLAAYAPTVTRSELEERFMLLCDEHGLPRPVMNARLLGYEVDAYWPAARLVVELDGYAHHRGRHAFEADRARDVALAVAGYRVLRFTYRQVVDESARVAAAIRRFLRSDPAGPR